MAFGFQVSVSIFGFRVWGLGLGAWGLGLGAWAYGFRVDGLRFLM